MSIAKFMELGKGFGLSKREVNKAVDSMRKIAKKVVGEDPNKRMAFIENNLNEVVKIWENNPDEIKEFKNFYKATA